MRRLAALLVLVPLAAACGGTVEPEPEASAAPKGAVVLARPAGFIGPVTAYDSQTLERRFEIPAGLLAADRSAHFALAGGVLDRFEPTTGVKLGSQRVGEGWRLAAVSANGRWVALVQAETTIRIVDARSGTVAHDIQLTGDFLVETVADDGRFLFLQQTFADGRYAVRGYDLAGNQMLPGSLATKGETVLMQGVAAGTVASPDGRWLLTLYVDTKRNAAFVHALNLLDRFPLCIDMPPCDKCTIAELRRWGLALGPDGRTLYAANPAIGRVAEVHLPTARVIFQSRFRPDLGTGDTRASVSPDGSRLAFTNGARIWSYDTHLGWAKPAGAVAGIADLGVSEDGTKAFVARLSGTPVSVAL
jgi:hypothetical protein